MPNKARSNHEEWLVGLKSVLRTTCGSAWRITQQSGRTKLDIRMDDGSRKYKTLPIPWDRAHARRIQETVESIAKNVEKGLSIDEAIQRTDISDAPKISREPNPQLILDAWKNYEKFKIDTEGLDQASFNKKYGGEANKECNPPRKKAQGQTFLRVKANAKAEDANDLLNKVGDGMEPGSRYRQQVVRQTADFLRFATGKQSGSLLDPEKWMPPVKGGLGIYTGTKSTKAQQKQKPSIALTDDEILNLLESLPVNHKQKSHAREAKKWEFAIQLCACFGLRPVELLHLEIKKGVLWTNYIKRSGGGSGEPRQLVGFHPEWVEEWRLLERCKKGEVLPDCKAGAGEAMKTYLNRNAYWKALKKQAKVVPYSFRHSYSQRLHKTYGMKSEDAANLMGHSEEVHIACYKEWAKQKVDESVIDKALRYREFHQKK